MDRGWVSPVSRGSETPSNVGPDGWHWMESPGYSPRSQGPTGAGEDRFSKLSQGLIEEGCAVIVEGDLKWLW